MYLESLEDRRLRSVTVVQGYPGFYEVYGDDSDNVITIDVNAADRTFSIDGKTFAGLNQLAVYGLGGNDLILVSSTPGSTISDDSSFTVRNDAQTVTHREADYRLGKVAHRSTAPSIALPL